MKRANRIIIRLGLDSNPLRRRIDRISVLSMAGLLAVFLALAPLASMAIAHAVSRASTAEEHGQRTWRQVPAVLQQAATAPPGEYYGGYGSWTLAKWRTPAGRPVTGMIAAPSGAAVGSRVPIWITESGRWAGMRLSRASAQVRVVLAIIATTFVLAMAVLWLAIAVWRWLERLRLAAWEASWNTVGPQWTKEFRTRGI
jgi:hypothetical protein